MGKKLVTGQQYRGLVLLNPVPINPKGVEVIATLYQCNPVFLSEVEKTKGLVELVIAESGLISVGRFYHQFTPHGVTGAEVLSESHLTIHTWPIEQGENPEFSDCAAINIFCCSKDGNLKDSADRAITAYSYLIHYLKPKSLDAYLLAR